MIKPAIAQIWYLRGMTCLESRAEHQYEVDCNGAVYWLQLAADARHGEALYQLAKLYLRGVPTTSRSAGLRKNRQQGLDLMRMAADVGFPLAFNEIGYAYAAGRHGLKKNAEQAKSWYERGAELGEKFCCFLLAQMYENGEGIAKDPAQAAHYFRVAAENGHGAALIFLARSQEKAGDFESAINSYSSAAIMSGDLDAAIHLADYYQHNNRLVEALTWLDFACAISVQKQLPGRAVELARCLSPDLVMQAIEAARRLKQAMSSRFPQSYNTGENFSHWLLFESSKAWERVNRLE